MKKIQKPVREARMFRTLVACFAGLVELGKRDSYMAIASQVDSVMLTNLDNVAGFCYRVVSSILDNGLPFDGFIYDNLVKSQMAVEVGEWDKCTDFYNSCYEECYIPGMSVMSSYREYLNYYLDSACQLSAIQAVNRLSLTINFASRQEITNNFREALASVSIADVEEGEEPKMSAMCSDYLDHVESLFQGDSIMIPTPFLSFNSEGGGLMPSTYLLIGALQNVGKTNLALALVRYFCGVMNMPTDIFSLEMTRKQLIDRMVSSESELHSRKLRLPRSMGTGEIKTLNSTIARISDWDMRIYDDSSLMSVEWIANKMRKNFKAKKTRVSVIDYAQICQVRDKKCGSREQEIAYISSTLKAAQKETGQIMILLSQLNKTGDARESMSLEQDADDVLKMREDKDDDTIKFVDVVKRREERRGYTFTLKYTRETGVFENRHR